jgi:hypothetical protein
MIGYARGIRGYKLCDVVNGKVVTTRDVRFNELDKVDPNRSCACTDIDIDSSSDASAELGEPGQSHDATGAGITKQNSESNNDTSGSDEEFVDTAGDKEYVAQIGESPGEDTGEASASESSSAEPRRSGRVRRAPGAWWANSSALVSNAGEADPRSCSEAMARPERDLWLESMQSEYDSLMENGCWELVPRPPNNFALKHPKRLMQ